MSGRRFVRVAAKAAPATSSIAPVPIAAVVCRRQRLVASSSRSGACSIVDDRFCATRRDDVAGTACTGRASVVDDRFVAAGRDDVAGAASAYGRSLVDDRFVAAGRDNVTGTAGTDRGASLTIASSLPAGMT